MHNTLVSAKAISNKVFLPTSATLSTPVALATQGSAKSTRYRYNEFVHSNYICMIDSVNFDRKNYPLSSIKELQDYIGNCHLNRT